MSKESNIVAFSHLRLLTLKEVRALTGYSANHVYRLMRAGQFPRSIKIGLNSVRWSLPAVEAWLEAKAKASGTSLLSPGE